mmetsp:Transcript_57977/g.168169  ORF Transcript_57977/g.168169 Transcript_57977/m.168169 type:complete len:546 (-) Transcript_57977:88-1725(-)
MISDGGGGAGAALVTPGGVVLPGGSVFSVGVADVEQDSTSFWDKLIWAWKTFNPITIIEEILVTIVIVVVLILLCKHQDRVIKILTGDDRIHGTFSDFVWFCCCQCCGWCRHDWTRCLTRLPCCPKDLYNANLVKTAAAAAGVATHTVELSNLIVGDLPFRGQGEFFLSVECAQNPPMTTSLSPSQSPKVVHFPEVITLRVRESFVEKPVRIKVFELRLVGSTELCEIHLSTMNVVHWAREAKWANPIKRFAMTPTNRAFEVATPPWISLEFNFPRQDVRELEHFHNTGDEVRTTKFPTSGGRSTTAGEDPFDKHSMADFKHKYTLVDSGGRAVVEPDEADLRSISCLRTVIYRLIRLLTGLSVIAIIVISVARLYLGSCYNHYYNLTQVWEQNATAITQPVSIAKALTIEKYCDREFLGAHIPDGSHWCRPSFDQVNHYCLDFPDGAQQPKAFRTLFEGIFGRQFRHLPPCPAETCQYYQWMSSWDRLLVTGLAGLAFCTLFCCRPAGNCIIDAYKHSRVDEHNRGLKTWKETMRTKATARPAW